MTGLTRPRNKLNCVYPRRKNASRYVRGSTIPAFCHVTEKEEVKKGGETGHAVVFTYRLKRSPKTTAPNNVTGTCEDPTNKEVVEHCHRRPQYNSHRSVHVNENEKEEVKKGGKLGMRFVHFSIG